MATDRDPRVLTKPCGRLFLEALPYCKRFVDSEEVNATLRKKARIPS